MIEKVYIVQIALIGAILGIIVINTIISYILFYKYLFSSVLIHENGYLYVKIRLRKE